MPSMDKVSGRVISAISLTSWSQLQSATSLLNFLYLNCFEYIYIYLSHIYISDFLHFCFLTSQFYLLNLSQYTKIFLPRPVMINSVQPRRITATNATQPPTKSFATGSEGSRMGNPIRVKSTTSTSKRTTHYPRQCELSKKDTALRQGQSNSSTSTTSSD